MKTILLTGATGFLGSHLLEALLKEGYSVVILKRSTSHTYRIQHLLDRLKTYDIDRLPLEQAFKDQRIDAVMHTACSYGRNGQDAHEVAETNLLFGLRLLDAATAFNINTFFNTDTLLPKYLNAYALSKNQFCEWLRQRSNQVQVVNLKLEHMYGPKDDQTKFVPWLIGQLEQGVERIPLTEGQQLRDFIYIDDVVAAYMLTLAKAVQLVEWNEFDVGTGKLIAVRDFVTAIHSAFSKNQGICKSELGFGDIPLREGEMMTVELDNTALINLGWSAQVSIEHGIAKTIGTQK
ncbi:Nucleoside-diphosphate-sugar epimerase [Pseudomonas guineae]|uniref:Nucleoside-diphosphate-sugar epimerase n=1 Tax=Pseudomonas guineae TaxID=425504 RepID=A0A1I3CUR5_9PSED|nr:NAD-dependent epimerase/dehydratase [Pseudomonas guineae]SFH78304.1 Nucleoside-diphosphate-sugar epimerase [Pseudomonas guineae]